jgi:hypothetical protein
MTRRLSIVVATFSAVSCAPSLEREIVMPALELLAAIEVATSVTHSCSRHEDGTVWCWGAGAVGQLGTGDDRNLARPAPVVGIDDAVGLAVGDDLGCARSRDDSVACWGRGDAGQLGEYRGHLADELVFGSTTGQVWRQGPRGSVVPVEITRAWCSTAAACGAGADSPARCSPMPMATASNSGPWAAPSS